MDCRYVFNDVRSPCKVWALFCDENICENIVPPFMGGGAETLVTRHTLHEGVGQAFVPTTGEHHKITSKPIIKPKLELLLPR